MKTLKEFDYDLWAIEENGRKRYFARIKATGEETEVSLEVMRLLLRQEKQMRREYAKQQTIKVIRKNLYNSNYFITITNFICGYLCKR